jgi:hypothetical protein
LTRDNENPGDQEIGIGTNNNGTLLKQNAMTRYLSRPANEIENNITLVWDSLTTSGIPFPALMKFSLYLKLLLLSTSSVL